MNDPDNHSKLRKCSVCGAEFTGRPNAKYCPECRQKVQADQAKQSIYRSLTGTSKIMGSLTFCQKCGAEFIILHRYQRYCPDCSHSDNQIKKKSAPRCDNSDMRLVTLSEYAQLHEISLSTVKMRIHRRLYQSARKIGRLWYIDPNEIIPLQSKAFRSTLCREKQSKVKGLVSLSEYAKQHEMSPSLVRYHIQFGRLQTAQKISNRWMIDPNEPAPPRIGKRCFPVTPHKCAICGEEFSGSYKSKYCPKCRKNGRVRACLNRLQSTPPHLVRKLGSMDICERCGSQYTVVGSTQKYCPECSRIIAAQQRLDSVRRTRAQNKSSKEPERG